ncbi:MAG TPA: CvpA family protein [Mesorhizobium sp.]|jgi:membrane protein required for colicin V production
MPITLLDGIVAGFTLVSAMLAMVRGFSREVLSIASWVAAAAAAYLFYKPVLPYVQPYIDNEQIAVAASAGVVFLVALIVVTVITMKIADFIIDSRVGALDRALGFLYGAARGILVLAVGLLFFTWLAGPNPPAWVTEAKSKPLLDTVGGWIEGLLPENPESLIPSLPGTDTPPAEATPPAEGTPPADSTAPAENATPPEDEAPAEGEPPAEGEAPADGATEAPANN